MGELVIQEEKWGYLRVFLLDIDVSLQKLCMYILRRLKLFLKDAVSLSQWNDLSWKKQHIFFVSLVW